MSEKLSSVIKRLSQNSLLPVYSFEYDRANFEGYSGHDEGDTIVECGEDFVNDTLKGFLFTDGKYAWLNFQANNETNAYDFNLWGNGSINFFYNMETDRIENIATYINDDRIWKICKPGAITGNIASACMCIAKDSKVNEQERELAYSIATTLISTKTYLNNIGMERYERLDCSSPPRDTPPLSAPGEA